MLLKLMQAGFIDISSFVFYGVEGNASNCKPALLILMSSSCYLCKTTLLIHPLLMFPQTLSNCLALPTLRCGCENILKNIHSHKPSYSTKEPEYTVAWTKVLTVRAEKSLTHKQTQGDKIKGKGYDTGEVEFFRQ